MKRILSLLIVLVVFLCLVSCDVQDEPNETDKTPYYNQVQNFDIKLWTDEETGVQYIIYNRKDGYGGMGGITPRLNSDGTLYTTQEKKGE